MGIMKRSAIPEKDKIQTATNEVLRRWRNTSKLQSRSTVEAATKEYADELRGMGYAKEWIENVIRSALLGFKKYCHGTINRPGMATRTARRRKKLVGKSTWFEKSQKQREDDGEAKSPQNRPLEKGNSAKRRHRREEKQPVVETAIFIPHTPGGALRDRLNKMEEGLDLTGRVKYVEELGSTLQEILCNPDPWKNNCGRPKSSTTLGSAKNGQGKTQTLEKSKPPPQSNTACSQLRIS